jgi:hypothetical protein
MIRTAMYLATAALGLLAGCRPAAVTFPARPVHSDASGSSWDTDGDGQADFFAYRTGPTVDRIGYDHDADGRADRIVRIGGAPGPQTRHLVIILDGFAWQVVRDYRSQGRLGLFHPPSKVVAPYPTLTDLCLEDLLGWIPTAGFEAEYFDRQANRVVGGEWAYLQGHNSPYNQFFHYRANLLLDAVGYLWPRPVFRKEIHSIKRDFDASPSREFVAYVVSSAGISTKFGRAGQIEALAWVERLAWQVVQESQGLACVTVLSDHGHSYTPGERISLEAHLRQAGWRIRSRLEGPRDVVYIRFGLETYAGLYTRSPARLAGDCVQCDGVELASWVEQDAVLVASADGGRARIEKRDGRFRYTPVAGDPLALAEILAEMGGNKFRHPDEMLAATVDHRYPAPLQRLWRAHFAQATNPPDVILSLGDGWYSGSRDFAGHVEIASTHGSLNRNNSVTFILSTAGPLPPVMRARDVAPALSRLLGRDWPVRPR